MQDVGQPSGDDRNARRPNLQSVVAAVEGEPGRGGGGESGGRRKRALGGEIFEEKADVKRRNQRLFGSILGTLQRFSREEQEARSTTAAQRRAELEQKAEQKKVDAAEEARRRAREEMQQLREGEAARRSEARAQAACGRLEALYATRLARLDKLASRYFRTATGPALYWCPGKPCAALAKLEEQQWQEHEVEKDKLRQQMEREKADLVAQFSARRQRLWGGAESEQQRGRQQQEERSAEGQERADNGSLEEDETEEQEENGEQQQQQQGQDEQMEEGEEQGAAARGEEDERERGHSAEAAEAQAEPESEPQKQPEDEQMEGEDGEAAQEPSDGSKP